MGLYQHSQTEGWLGPVIGGSAGALFDGRNRWRGTVVGAALGAVIQTVSTGNLGYWNYGAGY
ncbi:MAG: glycine zipper 2TM domain-containing protein [Candidatus Melainabacteria bacterium]|nr:glycine zipper 2TM domain-containing protein [Candidatus Melainabacteria bacterium]